MQPFDHRTTEGQGQGPLDKETERWAPHSAVTVKDAFSDLPDFTVEQDRDEGMVRDLKPPSLSCGSY